MEPAVIDFWYELASTYSYPAAMRIEAAAAAEGVRVAWKPFLLGPILQSQGWSDSPFNLYPVKGRYMWRDLERIAAKHGLEFRRPSRFPRNGLLGARVLCAAAAAGEPWVPAFTRALYVANFVEDREIGERATVVDVLGSLGLDGEAACALGETPEAKDRLRRQTEEAARLGIFGAPSFVAAGELFWGNDRLDDAIDWVRTRARLAGER